MWLAMTRIVTPPRAPHRRLVRVGAEGGPATARGLYPGEPEACRRSLRLFLPAMAQLALLLAVVRVYRLDPVRAFDVVMTVALCALPVHYLLPYRWKKPFFVAASAAAMAWIFGMKTAAVAIPAALGLIGLAVAPIAWGWKVLGCGAAAIGLGLVGAGVVDAGLPAPVVTVLGAMFMFRMIIFLYEMKHAKGPEPASDALGYFFLLPNYCFLHFPVVDYRTMQRGYFAGEVHAMQRDGLRMMLNGVIHLLLYRFIYHELLISPDQVAGPASLGQFLIFNYLLYLHVSGQFHVACGMLHLFGYKLPETHHRYLLATGFTDYWRRINIYWKDFMVRVVFNPVAFRLKRRPQWVSLSVATAVVFVVTWLLHAYQLFWLTGRWGFSVPDGLFWGILGVLVMVNVQLDARRSRSRARAKPGERPLGERLRELAVGSAKVAGTLTTITLLWSLWTSPSLGAWLSMIRRGLWPS